MYNSVHTRDTPSRTSNKFTKLRSSLFLARSIAKRVERKGIKIIPSEEASGSATPPVPVWIRPPPLTEECEASFGIHNGNVIPYPKVTGRRCTKSPPLSPRFMNPRRAPQPPSHKARDPESSIKEIHSEDFNASSSSTVAEFPSFDTFNRRKNSDAQLLLPIVSPSMGHNEFHSSSSGSALELIGVALLGTFDSNSTMNRSYCSDTSQNGDQSMGAVFDVFEQYGIQARDILLKSPQDGNERLGRDSMGFSSSISAPARISNDTCLDNILRRCSKRVHTGVNPGDIDGS